MGWGRTKLGKRVAAGIFFLFMILFALSPVLASGASPSGGNAVSDVELAGKLGILLGDGHGLTPEYLAKPTTRIQAAVMYLRLKGLEQEAEKFKGSDQYADSLQAGKALQPLLAYLKAHPDLGWQGIGENRFDPLAQVTVQQFYKVMLSALGYQAGTDFAYEDTLAFAMDGIYTVDNRHKFVNRDIATAAIQTLSAKRKGTDKTLFQSLVDAGALKPNQAAELSFSRLNSMTSPSLGDYSTDAHGRTLYYFAKDVADPNACQGGCLKAWPAFYADTVVVPTGLDPADFGDIPRADGSKQTTYEGHPLYYYIGDGKRGDVSGQDVQEAWYVIQPGKPFEGNAGR